MDKECRLCHTINPIEKYLKRPTKKNPDNRRNECLECRNKKCKEYYHLNPDRCREYTARWMRKHTGNESNEDRIRKWQAERYKRTRKDNPEWKAKSYAATRRQIFRRFSITEDEYKAMVLGQGNLCAICRGEKDPKREWNIDHDHVTGKVRGLLCRGCNTALHKLEQDATWGQKALDYLNATS